MIYPGLGFIDFPDFNPAVDKAADAVKSAKEAADRADVLANTYKVEQKHWDKLARTERKFQKALGTLNKIYPESKRGLADELGGQIGILALLAALALIGSTALLHVWVNRDED